jgi:sugar O-acyltransferase (sialic acid O-acetyltransferase NeuD family)
MKNKLLIIGAGGHGKVVADIALKLNRWKSISFLDDSENIKSALGLKVIGKSRDVVKYINDYEIFIGIGNNIIREKLFNQLESMNVDMPTIIHPNTIIGSDVQIGLGTVVMGGAVINCSTTIGKGCIVNTGATIDHDNKIADFVHVSPGVHLAGNVKIGKSTWIGIGSTVSNNIHITNNSIIGAGGLVISDINEPGTYVGTPVRKI